MIRTNNLSISQFSMVSKDEYFSHQIISEKVIFPTEKQKAWRKIIRKEIKMPNGKKFDFDILSQGNPSVLVFTWDTLSNSTTLIKEYQPGSNEVLYGTVAGMYEISKHDSPLQCAQYELEEEAKLRAEKWIPLLKSEDISIPFDKYSDNRFYPYLAINPTIVSNPRPLDDEEFIKIEPFISKAQLLDIIYAGKMNVASSFAVLLALRKLEELSLV
jgi:hypothetical protein